MAQVFVHGFFHADPHPGNLMILPGHVICFLDMGMMGRLDRTTRERIVDLVMSVVRRDESGLVEALLRITQWDDEPDRHELEKDATELAERHLYKPLHEMSVVRLMHQIFEIAARHKLRIPSDVLLLIKALSSLDGLGRALDPDFNLLRKAAPFVERVQRDRYHPARLAQELFDQGGEMLSFLRETPGEIRSVLHLVREGKLRIQFEHFGLDSLLRGQDRTSNRLSFAIVLASLVVGSSLIVHSGIPPLWYGIPVIGLVGFLVAGLIGFWLLFSIMRRGKP
jgi:ubiquinone biosynthesis protein